MVGGNKVSQKLPRTKALQARNGLGDMFIHTKQQNKRRHVSYLRNHNKT